MKIDQNVSLKDHSTMALGGNAAYLCEAEKRTDIAEAVRWAAANNVPVIMIGDGSNIVWQDNGFPGLVIVNNIKRYEAFEEDEINVYLTVGAGEIWDSVVERSVAAGLTGIEALSLIPGRAGATPIQNVGAYGQEISETLTTVEAFDTQANDFVMLANTDCNFGYRTSRFKTTDRGRFLISSITLHLRKGNPSPPFYAAVKTYFDQHNVQDFTPSAVREAVVAIRRSKLPDPAVVHNNGSFFANPVVNEIKYSQITNNDPDYFVPHWQTDKGIKLSAAWLIEQVGLRDYHDQQTGMATWVNQPLVLVNENAKSTADLLAFKQKVVDAVNAKFGIVLEQEPELLP